MSKLPKALMVSKSPESWCRLYEDGTAEIMMKGQIYAVHPEDVAALRAELMRSHPGHQFTFDVDENGRMKIRRTGYPQ